MSGDTVTITEAVRRLEAFDRQAVPAAFERAFYRALDEGRKRAVVELARTKLGKMVQRRGNVQLRLAEKKGGFSSSQLSSIRENTIPLIVRRSPLKDRLFSGGRSLTGGLETEGFAALIEKGGRTKAHQIKPIRLEGYSRNRGKRFAQLLTGGWLKFQVNGRWVTKRVVTHPGSKVPRNPFLEAGAGRVESVLAGELEKSMIQSVREAGLG